MANEDNGGSNKGSKECVPNEQLTAAKIDCIKLNAKVDSVSVEYAKVDSVSVENLKKSSMLDQGKSGENSSSE